ncbi:MAG: arginyl-tRNA synthetase, partial [Abditibacteriota bacterium]|nr:arginyl-tRNA synthetase [Abditibacteriota bacterium]
MSQNRSDCDIEHSDGRVAERVCHEESFLTRRTLHFWLSETVQSTLGAEVRFWVKRSERAEWSSNVALVVAARQKRAPREVAQQLIAVLNVRSQAQSQVHSTSGSPFLGRVEEANGFLNFHLSDEQLDAQLQRAGEMGARYGSGSSLSGQRMNVEFVSADPTGPLTLSSGRIAAMGESLCRLLEWQGASITREFFINDVEASSKMRLLGESVGAFYRATFESRAEAEANEELLTDDWVRSVARAMAQREGNRFLLVPEDEAVCAWAHEAREAAVASQKATLARLNVRFDVWTSESALREQGRVQAALDKLKARGHAYERNGVLWLQTTAFGDEADRPLLRADGQPTYLASDIAYHTFKWERGFARLINIWTAEHRMYIGRTRAALQASGCDAQALEVLPCEGARLRRDGTLQVVGRGGGSVTLDEVLADVEADSLKYFLTTRGWEEALDIETDIA